MQLIMGGERNVGENVLFVKDVVFSKIPSIYTKFDLIQTATNHYFGFNFALNFTLAVAIETIKIPKYCFGHFNVDFGLVLRKLLVYG